MRYLLVIAAILTVLSPQILFMALAFIFGDIIKGEVGWFLAFVGAVVLIGALVPASVVTWINRKEPVIARFMLGLAAASTVLSVIGIGIGLTLVIGLLTVFGIFFLLSLPVLLFAVWNKRSMQTVKL